MRRGALSAPLYTIHRRLPWLGTALNHAARAAARPAEHLGRTALRRRAAHRVGLVVATGLIAPVNLRTLDFGLFDHGRIRLPPPPAHRRRPLLQRLVHGLLHGETPALEIFPQRAHGPSQAMPSPNKLAHRLARPEGQRPFQRIRGLAGAPPPDALLLRGAQGSARAQGGTALGAHQGLQAVFTALAHPLAHGALTAPRSLADAPLRPPFIQQSHGLSPGLFLLWLAHLSSVSPLCHAGHLACSQ